MKRIRINCVGLAAALAREEMTGKQLSEMAGVSRSTITAIRSGKRCSSETAQKLVSILGPGILEHRGA